MHAADHSHDEHISIVAHCHVRTDLIGSKKVDHYCSEYPSALLNVEPPPGGPFGDYILWKMHRALNMYACLHQCSPE